MRQIYQQEYGRRIPKDRNQAIQEMVDWLSMPDSGVVTRDEFEKLKQYVLHLVLQRYERPARHMRYYTRDWTGGNYNEEHTWSEYQEHLEKVAQQLPHQALELARNVSLHDAEFRRFDVDESSGSIEISLEILDGSTHTILELHYDNACVIGGYTDELVRMISDPDTDVLAEEVDVVDDSVFEHRMLLWPEGDFAIRFSDFSFSKTPLSATPSETDDD